MTDTTNLIDECQSFFTIWKDGSEMVQKKHITRGEAVIEAERLAEINPGKKFYIMRAVGHAIGNIKIELILEPGA